MMSAAAPALHRVWEDDDFIVLRRRRGPRSELLVAPASPQPSPACVARLEHAFALRELLAPQWAARPIALEAHAGRLSLVLEDPGGQVLAPLMSRPWELGAVLRLAVSAAAALRGVHERGLVHRDIKPAHILVDGARGRVWLT